MSLGRVELDTTYKKMVKTRTKKQGREVWRCTAVLPETGFVPLRHTTPHRLRESDMCSDKSDLTVGRKRT